MTTKTINKNMLRERAKKLPDVTEEMWQEVNADYRNLVEEYLSVQNHSPKTKKQYRSALGQFGWFMKDSMNNKPFHKVTKRDFLRFLSYLRDDRKMSSSGMALKKASVSSLCNYIENIVADEEEHYKNFRNFTRGLPSIPKNKVYDKVKVTKEEYEEMMKVLEDDENWLGMAWLATSFLCGSRRSETIQFKTEIINYEPKDGQTYLLSHRVRGKGQGIDGKDLTYMIPFDVIPYWNKWIETRGYESEYVFTTKYNGEIGQMSSSWADNFCESVLSHILGRRVNPHIFKASCITYHLEQGVDIKVVSKYIAHHNDISTTSIYDLRDFEEERNSIFGQE